MTYVICLLMLNGSMHRMSGILVERHLDAWLVTFRTQTLMVPSNQCLVTRVLR